MEVFDSWKSSFGDYFEDTGFDDQSIYEAQAMIRENLLISVVRRWAEEHFQETSESSKWIKFKLDDIEEQIEKTESEIDKAILRKVAEGKEDSIRMAWRAYNMESK